LQSAPGGNRGATKENAEKTASVSLPDPNTNLPEFKHALHAAVFQAISTINRILEMANL
jgi:hypothetical protein